MTVKLSPQKVKKLLAGYFAGIPQTNIARKARVDQSSVSTYAARFRQRTAEVGILAAAEEYGMHDEISELRSLATELLALGITAEDAKEGLGIIEKFYDLGVDLDRHAILVAVCEKVADPGFVDAAMKLMMIEGESGIGYEEALTRFAAATSQLAHVEKLLSAKKAELGQAESTLTERKQELSGVRGAIGEARRKAAEEVAKLEQGLAARMKRAGVKAHEIEEVARLKAEVGKQGLDITTVLKLAKEFESG